MCFINPYARENNGSSPSLFVIMEYMNVSNRRHIDMFWNWKNEDLLPVVAKRPWNPNCNAKRILNLNEFRLSVRLHAENKKYKAKNRDIYPKILTIQGIALKVIKNIQ